MGEYAEMMLDGTCCEACGTYLGAGYGFPNYCSAKCARDRRATYHIPPPPPWGRKTKCPECGKKVKSVGLKDHMRDMHSANGG